MAPDFPKMEEQELMQSSLTKGCPLLLSYLIIRYTLKTLYELKGIQKQLRSWTQL